MLKVESIKTTQDIIDSNGNNISRQAILWNDSTNPDWYEQFVKILNAALPSTNKFGRPVVKSTVDNIPTEKYRINGSSSDVPVYRFQKAINGKNVPFEVTSIDLTDTEILEEPPLPGNNVGFVY